jgi:hypothetical protein
MLYILGTISMCTTGTMANKWRQEIEFVSHMWLSVSLSGHVTLRPVYFNGNRISEIIRVPRCLTGAICLIRSL